MCFECSKRAKIKIATKEIVCYKVLLQRFNPYTHCTLLQAPYRDNEYKIGKIYHAKTWTFSIKLRKVVYRKIKHLLITNYPSINEGIHACTTKKAALEYAKKFSSNPTIIVKCIVAAGTEHCRNKTEIVALKMKLIKEV